MPGMILMLGTARTFDIDPLFTAAGMMVLAAGILVSAWRRRSTAAAAVAGIVLLGAGWGLRPWLVLMPSFFDGPPETQWLAWQQIVSGIWVLLMLAGATCLVALIQLRRL